MLANQKYLHSLALCEHWVTSRELTKAISDRDWYWEGIEGIYTADTPSMFYFTPIIKISQ